MSENDLETRVERLEDDLTSIKVDLGVLKANGATKSDIAELKANAATKSDIAELKANAASKSDIAELKTELANLRAETRSAIAESKNSMIVWVVSAVILSQLLPSLLSYFR